MRRSRTLGIGAATVTLIGAGALLLFRPTGASGTPVLTLLVDGSPSATVGAGSPIFLEVLLHGTRNASGPSIGGRLRPWYRMIAIRATQNGRQVALPFVEVDPPRVREMKTLSDGRPTFSEGETSAAALDGMRRVFRMELAAAPESTRQLSAGTYQLVASLQTPFWQLWGWRGQVESPALAVTMSSPKRRTDNWPERRYFLVGRNNFQRRYAWRGSGAPATEECARTTRARRRAPRNRRPRGGTDCLRGGVV